jgi:hypothetical protein
VVGPLGLGQRFQVPQAHSERLIKQTDYLLPGRQRFRASIEQLLDLGLVRESQDEMLIDIGGPCVALQSLFVVVLSPMCGRDVT